MSNTYAVFGLVLRSNRPLPALTPVDAARADVQIEFAEGSPELDPIAAETTADVGSQSAHTTADGGRVHRLASHGGERAWTMRVSGDGARIDVAWRGPVPPRDVVTLALNTGLPTALRLRGVPLLHGCAIGAGRGALVVSGASGAGKSSLAAAAVAAGCGLVADDVAALDARAGGVFVHVGPRQMRMNPDVARLFAADPKRLEPVLVTPGVPNKLVASLPPEDPRPRGVGAIFVLSERAAEPRIERLRPRDALPLILRNAFADYAVAPSLRAALLPFWTRLAQEVPVHLVAPPDRLDALPAFVSTLVDAAMLPRPCGQPSSSSGLPAP